MTKWTQSDNILKEKDFKTGSNPKHDRYQWGLASMAFIFFDKKRKSSAKSSTCRWTS